MLEFIKKVMRDCFTASSNDYDVARVVGYGFTILAAIEFLVMVAYATYRSGTFDGVAFAAGATGVAAIIAAAGIGTGAKKGAERPHSDEPVPPFRKPDC